MNIADSYPEILEYLDDTDEYENTATEFKQGDDRFLIVTQSGLDGQQLIFKWSNGQFEYWDNETIIDSSADLPSFAVAAGQPHLNLALAAVATCGSSSKSDHQKVHDFVVSQVDKFISSSGPEHGNLACVWTVRHLVKAALQRWITLTDGTSVFGQELRACFGHSFDSSDVLPGGIIISPTRNIPGSKKRNIGHVGFVGDGAGVERLIYSNASKAKPPRLQQNYTVDTWTARYKGKKGLDVLFYPLPVKSIPPVS